jgi:putative protease
VDAKGRFVAHDKHVLSMKDNNQSANIAALVDAGVRSFKIEGRYKDMGYVKNITAHYRKLLDELIEERESSDQPLARSSSGSTTFSFTPDPGQNFNREFTDYFVNGRQDTIGAFDSPKNPGQPIGFVTNVGPNWVELQLDDKSAALHNGDGLCYYDLQKELVGLAVNRAEAQSAAKGKWRIFPKDAVAGLKDLRKGTQVNRNRDVDWTRALEKKSSDRRMGVWLALDETERGMVLTLTDEDGNSAKAHGALQRQIANDAAASLESLREQLSRMGNTIFQALDVSVNFSQPWFVPASALNALRREAVESLEAARAKAFTRLPRALPMEPPAPFPEDTLSYLGNVFNEAAHRFYAKHGVKVIAPAYESMEELGEVSLMITKHCVRFSLSLCPKQAKGVTGVQGQVKAEPLQLINGKEKLTLRFDCKPCEMHVVGKAKTAIVRQTKEELAHAAQGQPVVFHKQRPTSAEFGH